jgi:hypothetical protein
MMKKFDNMLRESALHFEINDCTVIALAIAAEISYEDAYKTCWNRGRKARTGMMTRKHIQCFLDLDLPVYEVLRMRGKQTLYRIRYSEAILNVSALYNEKNKQYTANTITDICKPDKKYVAYTRDHVLAIDNKIVQDWTNGRKHRIISLFQIGE